MRSQFVALLLAVIMLLSVCACGEVMTVRWTLEDDGDLIIEGNSDISYDKYPWENRSDEIKFLFIKSGIKSIGDEAFANCSELVSVLIPKTVTPVGDRAFAGCDSLTTVRIDRPENKLKLGKDVFPEGVKVIYAEGFDTEQSEETAQAETEAPLIHRIKTVDATITDERGYMGISKDQPELLAAANEFIKSSRNDGTLAKLCEKYFGGGAPATVVSARRDPSKKQLTVATSADFDPFGYPVEGGYSGIDMELVEMLAERLGRELVIEKMDYEDIFLAVSSGDCDLAISGFTKNPEREAFVNFSEPYIDMSLTVIARADDSTFDRCTDMRSIESLFMSFYDDTTVAFESGSFAELFVLGDEDIGLLTLEVAQLPCESELIAMRAVAQGKADYAIVNKTPALYFIGHINY